jgi:hypothetical protein
MKEGKIKTNIKKQILNPKYTAPPPLKGAKIICKGK